MTRFFAVISKEGEETFSRKSEMIGKKFQLSAATTVEAVTMLTQRVNKGRDRPWVVRRPGGRKCFTFPAFRQLRDGPGFKPPGRHRAHRYYHVESGRT